MQYEAATPKEYMDQLPPDRKEAVTKLRKLILEHLPEGFEEVISYGMIGYVVPHSIYPKGYHCNPKEPLPFISVASQKHFIAFYHMGLYADKELLEWFVEEYRGHTNAKLDMGKSCIRFKKMDQIPYDLLGDLCSKISSQRWIQIYEDNIRPKAH